MNKCPFKYKDYVCPPSSNTGFEGIPQVKYCGLCIRYANVECVGEDKCPIYMMKRRQIKLQMML